MKVLLENSSCSFAVAHYFMLPFHLDQIRFRDTVGLTRRRSDPMKCHGAIEQMFGTKNSVKSQFFYVLEPATSIETCSSTKSGKDHLEHGFRPEPKFALLNVNAQNSHVEVAKTSRGSEQWLTVTLLGK